MPSPGALTQRVHPARDTALLAARRPSARRRLLPDFLIIGAQKSGTTSLHLYLAQHPAISLAFRREVHYFDWNFDRDADWYRAHFPTARTRDRSLRERGEFATGEKSPYYLFDPAVPGRVRRLLPRVRLIALLRNPVDRALSHYHQACRRGHERLGFEEALERELAQREPPTVRGRKPRGRSYLARGRYAEQLERWLGAFPRDQLHVMTSERFFADPGGAVLGVHRFLGLTPEPPANLAPWGTASYAPMAPRLRRRLEDHFSADAGRVAGVLGEDPGWW